MAHTPGPWKIVRAVISAEDYAILAGGIIAEVFHRIDDETFADAEANARLIAAAPDLVAALEKIANPPISPPIDKNYWMEDIARQALAKAGKEE